jgi:hypothetical protein
MHKEGEFMGRHSMKLLWLFIAVSLAAAAIGPGAGSGSSAVLSKAYFIAAVAGFLSWVYLTLRVFVFRANLITFVRRILSNEYEAGIKISKFCEDEVTVLSRMINRMSEQLAFYDELQQDRISVAARALDMVCSQVKDGVIIYDVKKKEFRFNPAMQAVYEIEQGTFSYEAISSLGDNRKFMEALTASIEKGKISSGVEMSLQVPVRLTQRNLFVSMSAVKDRDESAGIVIIYVR